MGPYHVESLCGAHYFLVIVDDASWAVWVYVMKEKGEVSNLVKKVCTMAKTQFHVNVKIIMSDSGQEFTLGPIKDFYSEQGIIHQTSCIDTPQQNGRVEWKIVIFWI